MLKENLNLEGQMPSVFNNPDFGSVRVITREDGEPLFCLKDVCDILEVGKTSDVKNRLGEDTVVTIAGINPKNPEQGVIFVNEDGLYDVILDSRKPEAKRFRKWVTSEVLPSIRKTGSYSVQHQLPQNYVEALEALVASEKEKLLLQDQNDEQKHIIKQQSDVIDVLALKAQSYEDQLSVEGWFTGSEAAKQLRGAVFQSGRTNLYKFLREKGIFNKSGEHPMPAEKYLDAGWFKVVRVHNPHLGEMIPVTMFSQKGIDQITNMLIGDEMKKYIVGLFVSRI